jgi:hypothetical protein
MKEFSSAGNTDERGLIREFYQQVGVLKRFLSIL